MVRNENVAALMLHVFGLSATKVNVSRLSDQKAEGWMMNEDRTKCLGIMPDMDTGQMIHHIVDISHNPPAQYCTFG